MERKLTVDVSYKARRIKKRFQAKKSCAVGNLLPRNVRVESDSNDEAGKKKKV